MWRIRYMIMRILKDNRGIGVVEVGTGNSSANVFLQARFRESHIYKVN